MHIYLDMNIYNRIFDDQAQLRIKFETMAIDIIFELIEKQQFILYWSYILDYENSQNPFLHRRKYIDTLSKISTVFIEPDGNIPKIAKVIMSESNAKAKDSLHIACAVKAECDYFITCDDKLIRTLNNNKEKFEALLQKIKLMNPVDFVREEMKIDVIE